MRVVSFNIGERTQYRDWLSPTTDQHALPGVRVGRRVTVNILDTTARTRQMIQNVAEIEKRSSAKQFNENRDPYE